MNKSSRYLASQILLMIFLFSNSIAQISGSVSVNSATPTSGNNFQSFTDLAFALNTSGINGPLVVEVISGSGPYNEQIKFNQITGCSVSNTITINGNGNLLFSNSSNTATPWILALDGSDYFHINNLKISGQASCALVCVLYNIADDNVFSNCTFSSNINSWSGQEVPLTISSDNNLFLNCEMLGGTFGARVSNSNFPLYNSNNSFVNCSFIDWWDTGIDSQFSFGLTIKACTFSRPTRNTSPTMLTAVDLWWNSGLMFEGNRIQNLFGGGNFNTHFTAINVYSKLSGNTTPNVFRNNIISCIKSDGSIKGFYMQGGGNIYHNTIELDGLNTNSNSSTIGIYLDTNSPSDTFKIRNNIVSIIRSGGLNYCAYYSKFTSLQSNNNLFHRVATTGSNFIGYYNNTAISSLTQWQALGIDANSYSVSPNFSTQPACEVIPTELAIDNAGAPLNVIFDADGFVRDQTTPDLGAIEFNSPVCAGNPSTTSVLGPPYPVCTGSSATIGLSYLNPALGLTYQWFSSTTSSLGPFNSVQGANSVIYTAPLITGPTWFNVIITCTLAGGGSVTATGSVNIMNLNVSLNPTICAGESTTLNASGAHTYSWSSGTTSSSITVAPPLSTTFYVAGTNTLSGCVADSSVLVTVNACADVKTINNYFSNIYPNPVIDMLTIISSRKDVKNIEIMTLTGISVYSKIAETGQVTINMTNFSPGLYLLRISTRKNVESFKLVKD